MAMEGSSLHHLVECSLCKGEYKQPRILPCGHIFCEDCLHQYAKRNSQPGGKFNCPCCGLDVAIPEEGVSGFPQNFDLNLLQKVIKAKISSTASHGDTTGGKENPLLENISCKTHPNQNLSMYCERCEEAICTKCVGGHKGHCVIDLDKKGALDKTSLAKTRELVKLVSLRQNNMIDACVKERVEIMNAADRVKAEFKEQYDELCKEQLRVLEGRNVHVSEQCAGRDAWLVSKIEEGTALSATLKSCIEKHDELLKSDKILSVMDEKRKLEPVIEELTNINIDTGFNETIQWTFTPGKLDPKAIEQILGELKTAFIKCAHNPTSTVLKKGKESPVKMPVLRQSIVCPESYVEDVTVCKDGSIIAAFYEIHVLHMYSGTGEHTGTIALGADPDGIIELPDGNIAISFPGDESIKVYSRSGTHVNMLAEGQGSPFGMALLNNGALAVCYPVDKCVKVFSSNILRDSKVVSVILNFALMRTEQQDEQGKPEEQVFEYPMYVTAHGENGMIVSDFYAAAVYAFTLGGEGEYTCEWRYGGKEGRGPGMLHGPYGVSTDSQGRILIADLCNHRILLLSPEGEMLMELLTEEDGMFRPTSISMRGGKLVVGTYNQIDIYDF